MSDIAHEETDRLIEKIEKRLKREYAQAVKKIGEKLDDYFRRFEIKDKKWQEWVKTGKKTKAEYLQWRKGQMIMGKRWKELKRNVAEDMTRTNEIAASIVNGHKPEAYAINHNYATYEIESGCRLDTYYTLYDRHTVERMFRENPRMLPYPGAKKMRDIYNIKHSKDVLWNQKKLQSIAFQAIVQGESISKVATRISKEMGEKNRKAAIRNARTLMTGAENAGRIDAYRRAETMGIRLKQQWVATLDMRTRYEHRELDGQRVEIGKPFVVPSSGEKIMFPGDPTAAGHLTYNCRCTLIGQIEGFETDSTAYRRDPNIDNMSYEDWKKSRKERPNRITLPEEKAEAIRNSYVQEYRRK